MWRDDPKPIPAPVAPPPVRDIPVVPRHAVAPPYTRVREIMLARSQVQYIIRDPEEADPSSRLRGVLVRINLGRDAGGYTIAEIIEVLGWRTSVPQLRLLEGGTEQVTNVEGVSNSLPSPQEFQRYEQFLVLANRVITGAAVVRGAACQLRAVAAVVTARCRRSPPDALRAAAQEHLRCLMRFRYQGGVGSA